MNRSRIFKTRAKSKVAAMSFKSCDLGMINKMLIEEDEEEADTFVSKTI